MPAPGPPLLRERRAQVPQRPVGRRRVYKGVRVDLKGPAFHYLFAQVCQQLRRLCVALEHVHHHRERHLVRRVLHAVLVLQQPPLRPLFPVVLVAPVRVARGGDEGRHAEEARVVELLPPAHCSVPLVLALLLVVLLLPLLLVPGVPVRPLVAGELLQLRPLLRVPHVAHPL